MKKLIIASHNQGKVQELKKMFADLNLDVVSLDEYPEIEEVDETGVTFEENAVLKAKTYGKQTGELCIADDSGLVIDALDGAPGVYSKRFGKDDDERMDKALNLLRDTPDEERTARFVACMAVYDPKSDYAHN